MSHSDSADQSWVDRQSDEDSAATAVHTPMWWSEDGTAQYPDAEHTPTTLPEDGTGGPCFASSFDSVYYSLPNLDPDADQAAYTPILY